MGRDKGRVVVVGAGISGLVSAYLLARRGHRVTILEAADRVGGCVETVRREGFLVEMGPNSALETSRLVGELARELGIEEELVRASEAAKNRYVLKNSRLVTLPMSPGEFLTSRLFTLSGKLRLMAEPLVPKGKEEGESLASFVARRFGREFLDYAVDPFVSGVYAGDPLQLSVAAAFPRLYDLERRYGSVLFGAARSGGRRRKREKAGEVSKRRARLFSFRRGLDTLTGSLAGALAGNLKTGARVEKVEHASGGYVVRANVKGRRERIEAAAVVLALPAYACAAVVADLDPSLAQGLSRVPYPPVAMVFLGYRREQVTHPLDGFGFLVPQVEGRRILGTIWSSTIFPNRAPQGCVALTTFVGGSRQPETVSRSEEEVSRLVQAELQSVLKIRGKPEVEVVKIWPRAIPQYSSGHIDMCRRLAACERRHRGIFFRANYTGGISLTDCIVNAEATACAVEELLDG